MNSIEEVYDFVCHMNNDSNIKVNYQKDLKMAEWLFRRIQAGIYEKKV